MTHISVCNLVVIGSGNGLSPGQRQANIWTNAGILLTGPLGTHLSEIFIDIHTFSFKKLHLKRLWYMEQVHSVICKIGLLFITLLSAGIPVVAGVFLEYWEGNDTLQLHWQPPVGHIDKLILLWCRPDEQHCQVCASCRDWKYIFGVCC